MRRRYETGGLSAVDDQEALDQDDSVLDPEGDESELATPTAGALSSLDSIPGAQEALALMAKSSEEARQALSQARESIMARRYGKADAWLAASAALGAPTRAGSTAESFGAMAGALRGPLAARREFDIQKDKDLLGVNTQLSGLDQRAATTQLQLAALRANLAAKAAAQPLEKVIVPGHKNPVGMTRQEAHGKELYVTPPSQTTVNVGAQKKLFDTMGEKLGETYTNQYAAALKAPQSVASAAQLRELLQKNPYTGAGADWKLNIGKAAKALGFDYAGDDIQNTELLFSNLGRATLDSIKTSGLGTGNGFTDKDLKFLEKVVGGSATLDNNTLAHMADLHESVARAAAKQWNDTYGRLSKTDNEALRSLAVTPIDIPDAQTIEAPATAPQPEAANPDDTAPAGDPNAPAAQAGARYGLAPAAWAVDPANPPPRAPPAAEAALKGHPERVQEFVDKYHYVPHGG